MKKLLSIILIFLLFISFTFIKAYSYSETISSSLEDKILRLHIIANSNNSKDQLFKLKCRDNIISYLNSNIDYTSSSKEDISNFISNHINNLYQICYSLAETENYNTDFKIELSNSFFPTKQYGNILMPSGYYDCLKINIGSASGNNWWCSLFPPLCFSNQTTSPILNYEESHTIPVISSTLSSEEASLLTNSQNQKDIHLKFKIIEAFSTIIK